MKILILSWRDPDHPLAGGAERITEKYARFWSEQGYKVVWMSGAFPGGKIKQEDGGLTYLRITPQLSHLMLFNVFLYPTYLLRTMWMAWRLNKQQSIDLVIDEIHGLPFFTPLFCKNTRLLVCEVAGPIWDKMYRFPINIIGKVLERLAYQCYQRTPIWAISQNTKEDVLHLLPQAKVAVLPLGIDINKHRLPKQVLKHSYPSAIFLARLVKMKGIEVALEATKKIVQTLPDFQLTLVGKGGEDYEDYLRRLVKDQKLERNVRFLGYVSEEEKYQQLAQAHFLFHPSYKEGFGLTVLEAGLMYTPAIVKKGSSLDELVLDGKTGFIIEDADQLAKTFIDSWNSNNYQQLARAAYQRAIEYAWPKQLQISKDITGL